MNISKQDLINSGVEESILTQGISDYLDKNSTNWKCIGTNEFGDFLIDLEREMRENICRRRAFSGEKITHQRSLELTTWLVYYFFSYGNPNNFDV